MRSGVRKAEDAAAAAVAEESSSDSGAPTIGSVIMDTMHGLGFDATTADTARGTESNPESMEEGESLTSKLSQTMKFLMCTFE